ncbi:MAG: hypothetical protein ACW97X_13065 [Candidatus Hodarchaeales archaeon]|jgi:hypothetical protein
MNRKSTINSLKIFVGIWVILTLFYWGYALVSFSVEKITLSFNEVLGFIFIIPLEIGLALILVGGVVVACVSPWGGCMYVWQKHLNRKSREDIDGESS